MFRGDEDVTAIRTRTAWNLLAPTLLVFLAIGISPLEQVFIRSLTNERFASSAEVEFIGLNNYAQLLGMRLDEIPCSTDEITGECLTELDDNGNIVTVYPSSRRYLSDNIDGYRSRDYRPMDEIHIFGTRYAISARDSEFIQSFVSSVIYTVVAIGLQLVIGMFMAMVLIEPPKVAPVPPLSLMVCGVKKFTTFRLELRSAIEPMILSFQFCGVSRACYRLTYGMTILPERPASVAEAVPVMNSPAAMVRIAASFAPAPEGASNTPAAAPTSSPSNRVSDEVAPFAATPISTVAAPVASAAR